MALRGRGSRYSRVRHYIEEGLGAIYGDGWAARLWWRLGGHQDVRVVRHEIAVPGWPAGAAPLRLGFMSDLHAGPTTDPRLLTRACRALAEAEIDVLLLGGDYVFLRAEHIDAVAREIAAIPAPLGRYAVMGNHDLWADDSYIAARLQEAGVTVLVNAPARLPPPADHVWICGLDEAWVGRPDAAATFAGAVGVRVLLMHAPSGLLAVGDRPFAVALCGHTHGGHIALPGGVPIVTPGPLSRRYNHGKRHAAHPAQGPVLISRGVGGIELPVRLHADPDVLVCTLR